MPIKLFLVSMVNFRQERLSHHSPEGAEPCLYPYRVQVVWISCLLGVFTSSPCTEAMNLLSEFWGVFHGLSLTEGSGEVSCFHACPPGATNHFLHVCATEGTPCSNSEYLMEALERAWSGYKLLLCPGCLGIPKVNTLPPLALGNLLKF